MLRYLGTGFRQFGHHPITPHPRLNWEFFAVVKGRCAVRERGRLVVPFTSPECQRLVVLARQVHDDFHAPSEFSQLAFQCLLLELSLLALRKLPHRRRPQNRDKAHQVVAAATAWFTGHISANPTIDEVARQVHVSPSTQRRLFQQTMHERPVRVFRRIQIENGMRLMTETTVKLEIVAEQSGFTSTSDFCRAFKADAKVSPNTWRRTLLGPPRGATEVEPASRSSRGKAAAGGSPSPRRRQTPP